MTNARIRRGGTSRLSSATRRRPRGDSRSLRRQSRIDRLMARIPVSEAMKQRAMTWTILGGAGACVLAGALYMGVPGMVRMEFAQLTAKAGFEVDKVEVRGVQRMDELQVYNIALGQVDRSMVNVDLSKVRQDLLQLGWVRDARVSRRLPDTLVVDIVEREPVAVWQHDGELALIDVNGTVLQPVSASKMPDLPLVVGPSANMETAGLSRLLEAAPSLKPMLAGATWVGNRRWDLHFQSGETLSLPEGDQLASAALVNFARMDGVNHLLGRGVLRFDMRDPDRFVLRLPHDRGGAADKGDAAEASSATNAAQAPKAGPSGDGEA